METNGASGVENAITPADLEDIYGVIIAADKDVNAERFNGLPVIEVPVKEAIHHPVDLINKVIGGGRRAVRVFLPRRSHRRNTRKSLSDASL